jgi:hypothetical protein
MKSVLILAFAAILAAVWFGRSHPISVGSLTREKVVAPLAPEEPGRASSGKRNAHIQNTDPSVTKPQPFALSPIPNEAQKASDGEAEQKLVQGRDLDPRIKNAILKRLPPEYREDFLNRKVGQVQPRVGEIVVAFESLVNDCPGWETVPDHTTLRIDAQGRVTEATVAQSDGESPVIPKFVYECRFEPYFVESQAVPVVTYFTADRAFVSLEKREALRNFQDKVREDQKLASQELLKRYEELCREQPEACEQAMKKFVKSN